MGVEGSLFARALALAIFLLPTGIPLYVLKEEKACRETRTETRMAARMETRMKAIGRDARDRMRDMAPISVPLSLPRGIMHRPGPELSWSPDRLVGTEG